MLFCSDVLVMFLFYILFVICFSLWEIFRPPTPSLFIRILLQILPKIVARLFFLGGGGILTNQFPKISQQLFPKSNKQDVIFNLKWQGSIKHKENKTSNTKWSELRRGILNLHQLEAWYQYAPMPRPSSQTDRFVHIAAHKREHFDVVSRAWIPDT